MKELRKLLKNSTISENNHKEIESIFNKLLETKYNKEKVIEKLLHQANFDVNVFQNYWAKTNFHCINNLCNDDNVKKAREEGFDQESSFGTVVVGLVDYFIKNQTK